MAVLVIAEHDNAELKASTLVAVSAARALNAGDVDLIVAGSGCAGVADAAAKIEGVARVRLADVGPGGRTVGGLNHQDPGAA